MIGNERGPEWQGDDSFGAGWGNQTTHDQPVEEPITGQDFGAGAKAGELSQAGYGAAPGSDGFAIRNESWHSEIEKIREHMEVLGADGGHVGTVDAVRGEHIVLTRSDPSADGAHHGVPTGWVTAVDKKVHLNLDAEEARRRWRVEERSRALFERRDSGSDGPHALNRAFGGTYSDEKK